MSWSQMGVSKSRGRMGFRDLVSFNKALLAKQCWRLLKSPESLVAQIIKAKYYPNDDLLEAKVGSKPFFAWRSLQGAKELLEAGLFWRIDNGHEAQIWGDCWLPQHSTYRIQSTPKVLEPTSRVKELINENTGCWDHNMLSTLFTAEECEVIKTIPISQTNQPDVKIWRCTSSGLFSVKNAYHLAKELAGRGDSEGSKHATKSVIWKKIWSLQIPNAAKNFI
jgi:hypothetical protein